MIFHGKKEGKKDMKDHKSKIVIYLNKNSPCCLKNIEKQEYDLSWRKRRKKVHEKS